MEWSPHNHKNNWLTWLRLCHQFGQAPFFSRQGHRDQLSHELDLRDLPSGYVNSLLLNMVIFFVDLPSYKKWWFSIVMLVYQRVTMGDSGLISHSKPQAYYSTGLVFNEITLTSWYSCISRKLPKHRPQYSTIFQNIQ
jgi:hypothetical protein